MEALHRLVNDVETLRDAWERETYVSTGLGPFDDVLSVGSSQELIEGGLPLAATRLFREGESLPARLMTRTVRRGGRNATRIAEGAKAIAEIRAGATLAVDEIQLYSPAVARFTDALAVETGYEIDATVFLTPARAGGLGPHRDPVSFFLRQVHGAKRWRVWPAEAGAPADRPAPAEFARTEPELDVTLKEGDCIYIPRGRMHQGECLDEPSVHLSMAVYQKTWAEVLADAVREFDELNEPVPPRFSTADRQALLRDRLTRVRARLEATPWSAVDPARRPGRPAAPLGLQAALDRGEDHEIG